MHHIYFFIYSICQLTINLFSPFNYITPWYYFHIMHVSMLFYFSWALNWIEIISMRVWKISWKFVFFFHSLIHPLVFSCSHTQRDRDSLRTLFDWENLSHTDENKNCIFFFFENSPLNIFLIPIIVRFYFIFFALKEPTHSYIYNLWFTRSVVLHDKLFLYIYFFKKN
jgi:hypothetical protein